MSEIYLVVGEARAEGAAHPGVLDGTKEDESRGENGRRQEGQKTTSLLRKREKEERETSI